MIKDLIVALSLANLFFFDVWNELLINAHQYYRRPASPVDFFAALVNVLLLALSIWGALRLIRYSRNTKLLHAARIMLLLAVCILFFYISKPLPGTAVIYLLIHSGRIGVVIFSLVSGVAMTLFVNHFYYRIVRVCIVILLIFSPFIVLTFSQAVLGIFKFKGEAFAAEADATDQAASNLSTSPASSHRLVIILFDEVDYRIAFEERPASVQLPEIDRLTSQALVATRAFPPGAETLTSLPSLLTGRIVTEAVPGSANELMLKYQDSKGSQALGWSSQPNIFSEAQKLGVKSALVGWYHPYCRLFERELSSCKWEPLYTLTGGRQSLPVTMLKQIRHLVPWTSREQHIERHIDEMKEAKKAIVIPGVDLVLLHLSTPHWPWIYDRRKGELTTLNYSFDGYLDNLALMDRSLGEIRQALEAKNLWDETAVVVTSDHHWRSSATYDGKTDYRVPFILKLRGQKNPLQYDEPFNTVLLYKLVPEILAGQVSDVAGAKQWLEAQSPEMNVIGSHQ